MARRLAGLVVAAIGCAPVAAPPQPPQPTWRIDPNLRSDRDHDGVIDSLDGCPDLPGGAPGRGCPVADADADAAAVAAADLCPNEPETANGYRDDDGCPDVVPLRLTEKQALAPVVLRMQGEAIDPAALKLADDTIRAMTDHPEVRVEIAGHSDNREGGGDAERQRNIALARANAVRDYLAARGAIDPRRMTIRSAGADEPIDSNLTASGRARNRRVVLTIIER